MNDTKLKKANELKEEIEQAKLNLAVLEEKVNILVELDHHDIIKIKIPNIGEHWIVDSYELLPVYNEKVKLEKGRLDELKSDFKEL